VLRKFNPADPVLRFPNDPHASTGFEEDTKFAPKGRIIIDDKDSN
jgi:hypothetical protein